MRCIDLAQGIGLTASGVTRLLNPMEKIHLVEKESSPRAARVSLVRLSKTSEKVLNEAGVIFQQVSASLFELLKVDQIKQFLQLTRALKQ